MPVANVENRLRLRKYFEMGAIALPPGEDGGDVGVAPVLLGDVAPLPFPASAKGAEPAAPEGEAARDVPDAPGVPDLIRGQKAFRADSKTAGHIRYYVKCLNAAAHGNDCRKYRKGVVAPRATAMFLDLWLQRSFELVDRAEHIRFAPSQADVGRALAGA